jgi:hypothetical protein
VLAGHPEGRHDDHEDEQVVGRQALLHDVAREDLGRVPPPLQADEATRTPPPSSRRTPTTRRPHGPTACERRIASTRSSTNSASTIKSRTPQSAAVTFIQTAAVRLSAPCTPTYGIDRKCQRARPGRDGTGAGGPATRGQRDIPPLTTICCPCPTLRRTSRSISAAGCAGCDEGLTYGATKAPTRGACGCR